jgi:two-component system chemotaxis response regulator CheB
MFVPTVLVIDDSAVLRQFMTQLAERRGELVVVTAADPMIAEKKLQQLRPDVILLDLEMPRMSGLEFLRRQMRRDPIPVVVCSSFARAGSELAIAALAEGAVEVVAKPELGVRRHFDESAEQMVALLRAAALAHPERRAGAGLPRSMPSRAPTAGPAAFPRNDAIVAIGASTGGPQALDLLLSALPATFPPIVIAQHIPGTFSEAFARRLNGGSALDVREAADGEALGPGMARIAPGAWHLRVEKSAGVYRTRLEDSPPLNLHRPSVDLLFHSLARDAGRQAAGILLTGMGRDGAEGLLALRQAGARTVAQSEASCVVFGMPREAIHLGAADTILDLPDIPHWLVGWASA